MAKWNYSELSCNMCGGFGKVRIDVHNRLVKEGRVWVCRTCSSTKRMRELSTKHGFYGTPTYVSWRRMKDRCLNKNHKHYALYGGRGITITEKWLEFEGFLHDMGERPFLDYSLDRVDNDLGYSKENCRWIPKRDQPKNRRNTKTPYVPPLVQDVVT